MLSRIKNYLSLTKKEWNGMVVLLILIVLVSAAPYAYKLFCKDSTINPNALNAAIARLGARHISPGKDSATTQENHPAKYTTGSAKLSAGQTIELNTADSATLTKLHGIGASYAMRIVHYRERLGGFYRKEQLLEVFGMDADRYNGIKDNLTVNPKRVRRIRINTVTFEDLSHFPYLTYKQMNAIIQYRDQHGEYGHLADMREIAILDDGILRKIEPYLSFR